MPTAAGAAAAAAPAAEPAGRRIRVLYVIAGLPRAGAETQLARLALALDRGRFEPRIVLVKRRNDFAEELAAAGIDVKPLGRRGPLDPRVLVRLWCRLRRDRPAVVHPFMPLATLLAVPIARAAGVPAVVVSQRASYESTLGPGWRRAVRLVHRRAQRVLVNSQAALREELAAGFPAERLQHVPNGIDLPAPGEPPERADLGLPPGPLVACLAQLKSEKGHEHLIRAWALVRRSAPNATLALVGDGPLQAKLEAQCREMGVADSVRFLGFRHPARPYLEAADVVALASLTEGMPNAVLEAMACGRPVVATRVGGIPELVVDGETGALVPPRDPEALARALVELLADPARRASFGGSGRSRVAARFSMARVASQTEAVYSAVLGATGFQHPGVA